MSVRQWCGCGPEALQVAPSAVYVQLVRLQRAPPLPPSPRPAACSSVRVITPLDELRAEQKTVCFVDGGVGVGGLDWSTSYVSKAGRAVKPLAHGPWQFEGPYRVSPSLWFPAARGGDSLASTLLELELQLEQGIALE